MRLLPLPEDPTADKNPKHIRHVHCAVTQKCVPYTEAVRSGWMFDADVLPVFPVSVGGWAYDGGVVYSPEGVARSDFKTHDDHGEEYTPERVRARAFAHAVYGWAPKTGYWPLHLRSEYLQAYRDAKKSHEDK